MNIGVIDGYVLYFEYGPDLIKEIIGMFKKVKHPDWDENIKSTDSGGTDMGDVINFIISDELKNVTYTNNNGDLGVRSLCSELCISKLNNKDFLINDKLIDRESLAELLWVAATFIDSEEKWRPNLKLIGCNYD